MGKENGDCHIMSWKEMLRQQQPGVVVPNSEKAARKQVRRALGMREPVDYTITTAAAINYKVNSFPRHFDKASKWQESLRSHETIYQYQNDTDEEEPMV